MIKKCSLIILGSGVAGLTAAIYSARSNIKPIVIEGLQPGGQLVTTTDVDNWPGESYGIQGPELMLKLKKQAVRFGAKITSDYISKVNFRDKSLDLFSAQNSYVCKAVIIATGAQAKYLGLPKEQSFIGKGISACATCDGYFYQGKKVVIVGGGNLALEEALFLSNITKSVTIIHRRDNFRAEGFLVDKVIKKVKTGDINIMWNRTVKAVYGDTDGLNSILIKDTVSGVESKLNIDGMFVAIGTSPNTAVFSDQIDTNEIGYIKVKSGLSGNSTSTNIKGVFAAGDVADHVYRQAITSAGSGCMAALDAIKYLDNYN